MSESLFRAPDRIERLGGEGPEQPVWFDISGYSVEWYRRFRLWHHEQFPDADASTRANLKMLVETAIANEEFAEARKAVSDE